MSDNELWLSAVVELRPPSEQEAEAGGATADEAVAGAEPVAPHGAEGHVHTHKELPMVPAEARVARTKQFFTSSGFEVHAPVGRMFSIGATRDLFESFFGTVLAVQEDDTGATAVEEGELTLDPLPDHVRAMVKSIYFLPPPAFPG